MIEIKISGATPLEALASLTAFGFRCMSNEDVAAAANRIYEREQKEAAKATPAPNTPAPLPEEVAPTVKENPTQPPAPPSTAPSAPTDQSQDGSAAGASPEPITPSEPVPVKALSLEEVREAGIKAAKEYGKDAVASILGRFSATSMSTLKEQDRAAFLEALEGLGEDNA